MSEVSPTLLVWVGLAALPLVFTLATALTKSLVVVGALRTGLGAEALLPWPIVLGAAVVITTVVMTPVGVSMAAGIEAQGGVETLSAAPWSVWWETAAPWFEFLTRHASQGELDFFAELQQRPPSDPLVVVPAFLMTELGEALAISVVILVPFVLVDLIVSQTVTLIGLGQQPTAVATLPLKILLFLIVGGWDVVVGGLVKGYV